MRGAAFYSRMPYMRGSPGPVLRLVPRLPQHTVTRDKEAAMNTRKSNNVKGSFSLLCVSVFLALSALLFPVLAAGADLTVYAYDSFVSEWGPAGMVIPKFEKLHGVKVDMISVGDAGQVLNRAILEKNRPRADIVLGIDNNLLAKAINAGVLRPYRSPNLGLIPEELRFDPTGHVTPFDHGYFAVVYDSQRLKNPPQSMEDLLEPEYRNRIILQDPRTSSPGLGFLLWTVAVYGEGYTGFWE